MHDNFTISYRINAKDEIIFVSDEWARFADENDSSELVSERILHQSLWKFVTDITTAHIYRQILRRVRTGLTLHFTLRCDAPEMRRLLEMIVTPRDNGEVEFHTRPVWSAERASQKLLQKDLPRRDRVIVICSWCNKIQVAGDDWREVEEAVDALRLFHADTLPQLSHGMCVDCFHVVSEQLKKVRAPKTHQQANLAD